MRFKYYYYCILYAVSVNSNNYEGQICQNERHQINGICKNISDCLIAQNELKKSIKPENCGFNGTSPIVCCPEKLKLVEKVNVDLDGQKSAEKCKEYRNQFNRSKRDLKKLEDLPIEDLPQEIFGGIPVKINELPHMAAIGYQSSDEGIVYGCGASLISERFLLSAGHCAYHYELGPAKIAKLGTLSLNPDNTTEYNIARIIKHPEYKRPSTYHDIALFELDKNVTFNNKVLPICLHTVHNIERKTALVAGWGRTDFADDPSNLLLQAPLKIFNTSECQSRYPPSARRLSKGILDDSQICAGSGFDKKDTCSGDSGGPLEIGDYIVGITSFGKLCGLGEAYAVYTRVSHYINWIEDIVW